MFHEGVRILYDSLCPLGFMALGSTRCGHRPSSLRQSGRIYHSYRASRTDCGYGRSSQTALESFLAEEERKESVG